MKNLPIADQIWYIMEGAVITSIVLLKISVAVYTGMLLI